jgi:hypothetical protein
MEKKIISFSLWGADPRYTIGAIRNVELAMEYYPDWKCRFYCGIDVPIGYIFHLEDRGAEIIQKNNGKIWSGLYWRYEALKDSDICLIRDTDSRISQREVDCVNEWLKSNKTMHSMFDHPWHSRLYGIMPGLFGTKRDSWPNFEEDLKFHLEVFENNLKYGVDYRFFEAVFEERIKNNILIHDSINPGLNGAIDFPTKRTGFEFAGEVYDEQENIVLEHQQVLQNWMIKNGKI